jgi:hypothetical protein
MSFHAQTNVRETGASEVFFSQAGEQKNGGKKE